MDFLFRFFLFESILLFYWFIVFHRECKDFLDKLFVLRSGNSIVTILLYSLNELSIKQSNWTGPSYSQNTESQVSEQPDQKRLLAWLYIIDNDNKHFHTHFHYGNNQFRFRTHCHTHTHTHGRSIVMSHADGEDVADDALENEVQTNDITEDASCGEGKTPARTCDSSNMDVLLRMGFPKDRA